jgi:ubiquinol-cytochrome c reductase cytochrome b subunit
MRKIIDWLEHRTGIQSIVRDFLYEEIPASSGWHQIIGATAVFFFLVQAVTGILLAINYAPTPGDAYNSLKYIMNELTAGSFIRGLHHWGASMMIVIVVAHMLQVFLYGAYKKPREATWMLGVVLLLITLGFGLTGYLLPWDNRAYWGTVVTTQIAGQAPLVGPYLTRLLGGEGSIGVVTFARFYALHVVVLPPLMMLLIGLHVYLVRKHGVTPAAGDNAPRKKFFPGQVFKDTVGVFVAFMILFVLALVAKVPLEKLADPTDTAYVPRPEWYFLFLFQLLKFFKGPMEAIGSTVLPGLAVLALFAIPFIDRGAMVRLRKRFLAFGVVAFSAIAWTGLTVAAIRSTPPQTETATGTPQETPQQAAAWQQLPPAALAGLGYFRQENCKACHPPSGKKGIGPDLRRVPAAHHTVAWMVPHFKEPAKIVPGSAMPPVQLGNEQLSCLSEFVLKLDPQNETALESAPDAVVRGAMLYQAQHCSSCHTVNGAGMKAGPPLNGTGARHDRAWLEEHFRDPKKMSPGSIMPLYKFDPQEMDHMIQFLLALPAK